MSSFSGEHWHLEWTVFDSENIKICNPRISVCVITEHNIMNTTGLN